MSQQRLPWSPNQQIPPLPVPRPVEEYRSPRTAWPPLTAWTEPFLKGVREKYPSLLRGHARRAPEHVIPKPRAPNAERK